MTLERILVTQASMFLPGIPIIKHSGKSELDYAALQIEFEGENPKIILIENDSGEINKKFSLMVGQQFQKKIDFRKIFKSHEGIIFKSSLFVYANDKAMMNTIGLALINVIKEVSS